MKVKVVRGSNLYWYSKRIGEIFYTDNCSPDFDGDYYIPDEGDYINASDCEIVKDVYNSWIANAGVQPVADDVMVEVFYRTGEKDKGIAENFLWSIVGNCNYDILFYRETAKLSLDDAWDEPPVEKDMYKEAVGKMTSEKLEEFASKCITDERAPYTLKRPESKYTGVKKQSSEAIVADAFNQQHGTNLSEVDIVNIINALEALKKLET